MNDTPGQPTSSPFARCAARNRPGGDNRHSSSRPSTDIGRAATLEQPSCPHERQPQLAARNACRSEEVIAAFPDGELLVLDDGPSRFQQPSSVVQVSGNQWQLLRTGVINQARMKWFANVLVLFVCTGNTCRSPMAELLFKAKAAERLGCGIEDLEDRGVMVMSSGIAAMQGGGSTPEAVEVMSGRSLDLSQHSSQPLSEQLVRFADHIITMTRGHQHAIVSRWPEASARVNVLCRDETDVADPIGGPLELYEQCAQQIDAQLSAWLDDLRLDDLPSPEGDE